MYVYLRFIVVSRAISSYFMSSWGLSRPSQSHEPQQWILELQMWKQNIFQTANHAGVSITYAVETTYKRILYSCHADCCFWVLSSSWLLQNHIVAGQVLGTGANNFMFSGLVYDPVNVWHS